MPTDEPRFALVARQMVEDPAPIVPHLGYDPVTRVGLPYGDKPPLFFWLVCLFSFVTGGVGEVSARLPSFLSAIAAVLLTRRIGRLLIDEETGFMAAAILATSSQFFLRAGWCSIDMLLTALVLGSTYCWLRAARADSDRQGIAALALTAGGGLFAAAATLSKGPVGIIFPVTFLVCDRIAARWGAGRGPSSRARVAIGVVSFLVPVGGWIAAILLVGGFDYAREILFKQNVTRYVAAWNNEQRWYYYLYRLPIGLFPWTLLLPGAILAPRGQPSRTARPLAGILVACGLLFVFFSVSTGKRGVYLLPLYPALAILLAVAWVRAGAHPFRALASLHVAVLAAAGLIALFAAPAIAASHAPDLGPAAWLLGIAAAAATVPPAVAFLAGRRERAFALSVAGVAALGLVASLILVPHLNRRYGLRAFGSQLAAVVSPDDHLLVDQEGYEQILFYSHLRGARVGFDRTRVRVDEGEVVLEPKRRADARPVTPDHGGGPDVRGIGRDDGRAGTSADTAGDPSDRRRSAGGGWDSREARFPPGARVVFVIKGRRADRLRADLGAASRILLAARISDEAYFVIASR